jgi:hypothetical protein
MVAPAERVASDAGFRAALEAARSWGVSPSVFAGRELVTFYEHASGRLVASRTESAWTQEDRELAMALVDYEADSCPACGGHLPETAAAENEERYDAHVRALCHRCVAIDILHKSESVQRAPHPGALLLGAKLRTQEGAHDPSIPT